MRDFTHLKPMPLILREIRRWGIDKQTLELRIPKPKYKKFKDLTAGNSKATEEQLNVLFKAMHSEGKYDDGCYRDWMCVCYAICKICDLSDLDKLKMCDSFSSLGDNYDEEAVQKMVAGYNYQFPADNPLSYLIHVYLPKQSPTKSDFLKSCKRQYYYRDMTKFTGLCELKEIYEYFAQALRVTDRAGVPQFYLRYRDPDGNDDWRICDDMAPFQRDMTRCSFRYIKVTVHKDDAGEDIEVSEEQTSSLKYELNKHWRWACQTFAKTTFK